MTKSVGLLFLQISDTGLQQQENICLTCKQPGNTTLDLWISVDLVGKLILDYGTNVFLSFFI